MGFYSPYQKGPDIGSGINDLVSQLMQILMMKKMFPGQETSVGQTPLPQSPQNPSMPMNRMGGGMGQNVMNQAPQSMGGIDPMMIQKIMQMLRMQGGGI